METTAKNEQNGVSASKNDARNADQNQGLFPNAYCKIVPDVFGDVSKSLFSKPTVNVMNTNGVAQKIDAVFQYWKKTNELGVWKNLAQNAVVKNLDDLICSGVTNNILISATINYNANHIPKEVVNTIVSGIETYLETVRSQQINIQFGGAKITEVGHLVQSVTLDTTAVARIRQGDIIANDRIQDKSVIIGLASCENDVFSPLQTYLPAMKSILENFRPSIHGLVHCDDDGGQTKCLNFVDEMHLVKNNLFPIPPAFTAIQSEQNLAWEAMYKLHTMGHRFEIYTKEKIANDIIKIARHFNIDAQIIGHCETAPNRALTIVSEFGTFKY